MVGYRYINLYINCDYMQLIAREIINGHIKFYSQNIIHSHPPHTKVIILCYKNNGFITLKK